MVGFTKGLGKIGHMWQQNYSQCATSSLRFASASNNLIGLLTVGAVIGTGVTITSYVVEWRSGSIIGPIVLLTGFNADETIQATHAFTNEPVQSGTLYAVIKYIVINGIRYSPYYRFGQYSPDLFSCLGSITVLSLNCFNGTTGWPLYPSRVFYRSQTDASVDASRKIRFDLNADGTTKFFEWQFVGYNVADRITTYYVHVLDEENPILMSDYIIGANPTSNYTSTPPVIKTASFRKVDDVSVYNYQNGDYVLVEVTPRVFQPTELDTNWDIYMHCASTFGTSGYNSGPLVRTIDGTTVKMQFVEGSCSWQMTWENVLPYNFPANEWEYTNYKKFNNGVSVLGNDPPLLFYSNFLKMESWPALPFSYNSTCSLSTNAIRVQKVGSVITITFDAINSADYDKYVESYNNVIINSEWTNYVNDDTNAYYYKLCRFTTKTISCADSGASKTIYVHHDASILFDDINHVITINLIPMGPNNIPNLICNSKYSQAGFIVSSVNATHAEGNYDMTTNFLISTPISGYSVRQGTIYDTTKINNGYLIYGVDSSVMMDSNYLPPEWRQISPTIYGMYLAYVTAEITDNTDPSNNCRLTNFLNSDGTINAIGEIIYDVSKGIILIP